MTYKKKKIFKNDLKQIKQKIEIIKTNSTFILYILEKNKFILKFYFNNLGLNIHNQK